MVSIRHIFRSYNILNTLLKPDKGEVLIDGLNIETHKNQCKLSIGVVPQEIALYEQLSAFDNLVFWGGLYDIPKSALQVKALEALEMVGLTDRKDHNIQQAQGLSTLIILIMSAIGGSIIPLFIMPAIMKKIAVFSVNYWGIQGFYDIFWRGLPLIDILPRILVLTGIGLVMTVISVRLFKKTVISLP